MIYFVQNFSLKAVNGKENFVNAESCKLFGKGRHLSNFYLLVEMDVKIKSFTLKLKMQIDFILCHMT